MPGTRGCHAVEMRAEQDYNITSHHRSCIQLLHPDCSFYTRLAGGSCVPLSQPTPLLGYLTWFGHMIQSQISVRNPISFQFGRVFCLELPSCGLQPKAEPGRKTEPFGHTGYKSPSRAGHFWRALQPSSTGRSC